MEHREVDALVDTLVARLFVPIEASGRHVHLTKEQALALFGHSLTPQRPLSQPGQFVAVVSKLSIYSATFTTSSGSFSKDCVSE